MGKTDYNKIESLLLDDPSFESDRKSHFSYCHKMLIRNDEIPYVMVLPHPHPPKPADLPGIGACRHFILLK
jgi:hypothetical protein